MTIDGITALSEVIVLALTLVGARRMVRSSIETSKLTPRAMRVLRISRIGTYAVGAAIIMFAVYLAATKVAHIRSLESTIGTITAVQESSHTIAPYSFYVDYSPRGRIRHEFVATWVPFARKKGDTITVLYDPSGQSRPEALLLDSDWLAYMILFSAGGLVVLLSGWLYGWR